MRFARKATEATLGKSRIELASTIHNIVKGNMQRKLCRNPVLYYYTILFWVNSAVCTLRCVMKFEAKGVNGTNR